MNIFLLKFYTANLRFLAESVQPEMNHFAACLLDGKETKTMLENDIIKLEQLADLMDNQFVIPGTNIRVGLDAILGLVPGIGDTASMAVSGYIIHKAHKAGVHPILLSRMGYNVFVDWLIGLVPLAGDIFDVGFKANRKNVALIREHFKTRPVDRTSKGDALFI